MRKIDLHIHTIPSPFNDSHFDFDISKLEEYVSTMGIDGIAITNHNVFDKNQYLSIKATLGDITVFPGIEVDLCNGHILVITDELDIDDFNEKTNQVTSNIHTATDSLDLPAFKSIFTDLSKYLLIPHYDKKPLIPKAVIIDLREYITAGEVNSPKKFIYCRKDRNSLVPVYFSDSRFTAAVHDFQPRQTFIEVGDLSIHALKEALKDKQKVALDGSDKNLIDINTGELKISSGLSVVIGRRSSGKSYTLSIINSKYGEKNVKYIKQFSLVNGSENQDKNMYDNLLAEKKNSLFEDYFDLFRSAVDNAVCINDEQIDENAIKDYIETLKNIAKDEGLKDVFSKCTLFNDYRFDIAEPDTLKQLIGHVLAIMSNVEYRETINRYIDINALKALLFDLESQYEKALEQYNKKKWANSLMTEINKRLQYHSSAPALPDVSFYTIATNRHKRTKFKLLCSYIMREREIASRDVAKFKIQAKTRKFENATDMKSVLGRKVSLVDAYTQYSNPISFIKELKEIECINNAEIYKFFITVDYKILNEYGLEVSGGEQSEYNLLNSIQDARNYDMLLIDEPESSFDNIFLKDDVNTLLKDLAEEMPVVVVTHNNTIGGSIRPNYVIYTEKTIVDKKPVFRIYYGYPTDKTLKSKTGEEVKNYAIQLDSLEAGQTAYIERNKTYENIKN